MAGRNHAQGPLRSSCKLFLGPDWLREGCAATMAYTEYPSHLPCLLPQVDRTEFNLLTTHSKKLLHGKIQGKTQAQHIREPHAKSASCSNRKCCNVCKLFCAIFFYTHHRSIFMHILVHCGFASIRWVLMFCLAGVLLPLHTSNLLDQIAVYSNSIWPLFKLPSQNKLL